jgi:hypothetical protein
MKRRFGAWFYIGYVLAWALAVVAIATLAGVILFPVFGTLGGSTLTLGELARNGARYAAEWSGKVWALAIGLVLAFHHAYRHRRSRDSAPPGDT